MKNLCTIHGHHYFRVRVPADFYAIFGCREIKKALRCTDFKTVTVSAKTLTTEFERVINLMRSGILSKEQMDNLVREFFTNHLHYREGSRLRKKTTRDESSRREVLEYHDTNIAKHMKYLLENPDSCDSVLDNFLQDKNIALDKDSYEYTKLRRNFILSIIKASEIEKERIQGNFNNWYDDIQSVLKPKTAPLSIASEKRKGKMLSEVIQEYIKEKTTKDDWNLKNTEESKRLYHQFIEIIGDKPIADITRQELTNYVEVLKKLPKNLNKVKELRDKPFADVLAMMN